MGGGGGVPGGGVVPRWVYTTRGRKNKKGYKPPCKKKQGGAVGLVIYYTRE